jgi:hypothetical protein
MRSRKEIEADSNVENRRDSALLLEVLLDIRDLLARTRRQNAITSVDDE